jgi:hypothetical protein
MVFWKFIFENVSPLFYYINALFPSSIVPFVANLICFLSLVFTNLGIYFLVNYLTKNKKIALISSLSFLTILSISYYWIATGNLPYFSALWTIPFSLYFLEKSIREKDKKYFVFFALVFFISIITHVVIGFLIGLFMIIRFLFEGFNFKNIKKILFYGGIPVLLSAFWFIPFLYFSKSAGEYSGYVPKFLQLFCLSDFVAWGLQAGGIGIVLILFIVIGVFSILKFKRLNKIGIYYLVSSGILFLLLMGGLGKYYPHGVDPVRFILPFSIFLTISSFILVSQNKIFEKKMFLILLIIILVGGLVWNSSVINQNFDRFSYHKEDSRYGIFQDILNKGFPIENKIENYRFGTSKFIFGETLTYFLPSISQTFGYQDAGMLNAPRYYDMKWHIWDSENINDSIYWLDWFGIKYFEVEKSDVSDKFVDDSRFNQIMNYSKGYNFILYEYLDAKPIVSLVDDLENGNLGQLRNFSFVRDSPDEIFIYYNEIDLNDVVVFKEFYFKNWKAIDLNSGENLEVYEVGPGFMAVNPNFGSSGVKFYYKKSFIEYFGLLLSLIGILVLIFNRKVMNLIF